MKRNDLSIRHNVKRWVSSLMGPGTDPAPGPRVAVPSPEGLKFVFDYETIERHLLTREIAALSFIYWDIRTIIQSNLQDLNIAHMFTK